MTEAVFRINYGSLMRFERISLSDRGLVSDVLMKDQWTIKNRDFPILDESLFVQLSRTFRDDSIGICQGPITYKDLEGFSRPMDFGLSGSHNSRDVFHWGALTA
jgi:hypothetical protein